MPDEVKKIKDFMSQASSESLEQCSVTQCDCDTYLNVRKEKTESVLIALYLADLLQTCSLLDLLAKVKAIFKENYTMSDLAESFSWAFQREKEFLRRILKDIRASLHL
jgi:hypothetical protein